LSFGEFHGLDGRVWFVFIVRSNCLLTWERCTKLCSILTLAMDKTKSLSYSSNLCFQSTSRRAKPLAKVSVFVRA
jgi:hypothetical protein